jgi:two-component system response regulator (stage 0 sporulation protein F)
MSVFRRRPGNRARAGPDPNGDREAEAPALRRLLVCDDNASVTDLLQMMFAHESWTLEIVTTGTECLDALAGFRPDVVLLDQRLEGPLTGIQTAEVARRRGHDVPILLFSAYLDEASRRDAERLGLLPVSKLDFPTVVRHVNAAYSLGRATADRPR